VLAVRGVPAAALAAGLTVLAPMVREIDDRGAALIADTSARLT
jgi:hypothetical protein